MALLVVDPSHGQTGEVDDAFNEMLESELRKTFGDVHVEIADAGPGASYPAIFIHIVELAVLALGIISAPELLRTNLPLWKKCFDKVISLLELKSADISIDIESARNLCLFYALNKTSGGYESIELHSLIRHRMNQTAFAEDVTTPISLSDDPDEAGRQRHQEALSQVFARYIGLVEVDFRCFTIVVEKNGRCSYIERLP